MVFWNRTDVADGSNVAEEDDTFGHICSQVEGSTEDDDISAATQRRISLPVLCQREGAWTRRAWSC